VTTLTVANFNMHAGIDGWGRPFDYLAVCRSLAADVVVLEEAWTSTDGTGENQPQAVADVLDGQVVTCTLTEGLRASPYPGATERWKPPFSLHRVSDHSLYFGGERRLPRRVAALPRVQAAERGDWGIAVVIGPRLTVEDHRILTLPTLGRDRVRRAAIVVDVTVEGRPISVVGTHMSHLHMGSHRHYALLRDLLRTEARPDAVLLGDMNLWGPPVGTLLPEWHRTVKGRTWPTWNPHSQIDHILVRGALRHVSGEVLPDVGSDHRPVRAVLTL
jgi:endonuclease/exonuclease/phosphatase family metal-dependent hydrolase